MKSFDPTISKRVRRRQLRQGVVEQVRWFVNYRDPNTGQRKLPSFELRRDAEVFRADLLAKVHTGAYVDPRRAPSVAEAMEHWLANRASEVKGSTLDGYRVVSKAIVGPLLEGTQKERAEYAMSGVVPRAGARLLQMLGPISTAELTTSEIRAWHKTVLEHVGRYTANRALSMLKSVLALCEEDYRVRAPSMPTNIARRRSRPRKAILTLEDVGRLITAARADVQRGIYYAFPFLSGTRISEQLGLLWEDIDFERNVVLIHRIQERDGSLTDTTKTEAGVRELPMGPILREMLFNWRLVCPRDQGRLHRVFPGAGRLQQWPLPRTGGGGPLLYQNFRKRVWAPAFKRLDIAYVTPHSARHAYISIMQSQGVEVGLVAKLAGHASPAVTLGHYTQAVRGGHAAVADLERAFSAMQTAEAGHA